MAKLNAPHRPNAWKDWTNWGEAVLIGLAVASLTVTALMQAV